AAGRASRPGKHLGAPGAKAKARASVAQSDYRPLSSDPRPSAARSPVSAGQGQLRAVSERIESVGGFPNRLISRTPSKSLLQAQSLSAQNRRTDRRGPHARPRNLRRNLQALAMYKLLQIL